MYPFTRSPPVSHTRGIWCIISTIHHRFWQDLLLSCDQSLLLWVSVALALFILMVINLISMTTNLLLPFIYSLSYFHSIIQYLTSIPLITLLLPFLYSLSYFHSIIQYLTSIPLITLLLPFLYSLSYFHSFTRSLPFFYLLTYIRSFTYLLPFFNSHFYIHCFTYIPLLTQLLPFVYSLTYFHSFTCSLACGPLPVLLLTCLFLLCQDNSEGKLSKCDFDDRSAPNGQKRCHCPCYVGADFQSCKNVFKTERYNRNYIWWHCITRQKQWVYLVGIWKVSIL